jgi:hypothetical protein
MANPTTTTTVVHQSNNGLNRTVLQIMADTHNPQTLGTAYASKVRMFKKWVDEDPNGQVVGGKYITRNNVDKFFLLHLQYRTEIQSQNLKQFRNALKQYASNVEFPPGQGNFNVDSPAVEQACKAHQEGYDKARLDKPECAHANLMSNVLSEDDKLRLVFAGSLRGNWADYCTAQTTLNQTALRGVNL